MTEDQIFNFIGSTGGVILACALIPQIVLAHKRGSAEDISYTWQAIYITGLVTLMVYYAHFELWPVFVPVAVECLCVIYLTSLKVYFDKFGMGAPTILPPLLSSGIPNGNGAPSESSRLSGMLESGANTGRSPKASPSLSNYGSSTRYERM